MEVADAVAVAKKFVAELFDQEGISNLGLEEVEYDDARREWAVTLGFSRPWDNPLQELSAQLSLRARREPRSYKVVRINAAGTVISVKNRYVENSDAA